MAIIGNIPYFQTNPYMFSIFLSDYEGQVVLCEPGPQTLDSLDGLFFRCWLYSRNFGNDKHSQLFWAIQSVHRFACFRPLDQLRTAWKNATKHNIHQLAQRAQPILRSDCLHRWSKFLANKAGEYELREMPVQNVRSIFCWKILGCWGSATNGWSSGNRMTNRPNRELHWEN